jgi:hypothetical protein
MNMSALRLTEEVMAYVPFMPFVIVKQLGTGHAENTPPLKP